MPVMLNQSIIYKFGTITLCHDYHLIMLDLKSYYFLYASDVVTNYLKLGHASLVIPFITLFSSFFPIIVLMLLPLFLVFDLLVI